jgi:hypothetical protein
MNDNTTPATPSTQMSRRDLETMIVTKAWRDPEFHKALLADPKAVLQSELTAIDPSINLPASLNVHVHQEDANTYHIVLPRNPKDISLSEVLGDDLEAVAPQTIAIVLVGVVAAGIAAAVTMVAGANVVAGANGVVTANAVGNFNAVA